MNSVFEIFKIGIGPSSSHTVGPMKAGVRFLDHVSRLLEESRTPIVGDLEIRVKLYGSLASTGAGHGTDRAIALGLLGNHPDSIEPESVEPSLERLQRNPIVFQRDGVSVKFFFPRGILFRRGKRLPLHSNGMRFILTQDTKSIFESVTYSVGGGFIVDANLEDASQPAANPTDTGPIYPYPFTSAAELLEICTQRHCTIAELALLNEHSQHEPEALDAHICAIWDVMRTTIERGCQVSGILPGSLAVRRRAPDLFRQLRDRQLGDQLTALDWVNLWAIATNEENAAGGRIVTAPTNGAAGIIPAVLSYFHRFHHALELSQLRTFFLTATAIGSLYKRNASISGAEVGCQGEVGVACSMAAGGLASILGGTNAQIENAAEIGMEHNLGLTCDPIAGLVQIPCIERNAMGATKAISAARLALQGSGCHVVSLDKVIATMRRTGRDMKTKYKETSKGGLAVNAVDC